MSVELLDLIQNYQIVCFNDDPTYRLLSAHWDVRSFMNTNFKEEPESDVAAGIMLSDQSFLDHAIDSRRHARVLFFYMNRRMAELVQEARLTLALPEYDLQERVGSKIFLGELSKKLQLPSNEHISFEEIPTDVANLFSRLSSRLGVPFVVQDAQGESGWDTALVYSIDDLEKALGKIHHGLRAARYIKNNIPLSVHVCILNDEIKVRGPWLQIAGFPELSTSPFRFGGNDTNQSLITPEVRVAVDTMTSRISDYMREEGYRGIFGIDFLWDVDTATVYPQEINSRIVGGTRLLTGMQKDQGLLPDLVKHVQQFADVDLSPKAQELRNAELDPSKEYSQLIIRNTKATQVPVLSRLDPGIYELREGKLCRKSESLCMEDMDAQDILITSCAHTGCTLSPGEAMARMLLKRSVIASNAYELTADAKSLINAIRMQVTGNI